jgi:hypothetical protein
VSNYRVWIKEKQVLTLRGRPDFAFAYSLKGPSMEAEVCEDEVRGPKALPGYAEVLREVIAGLPLGSHLLTVTDYDALVRVYDQRNYIAGWRSDGFRGRPEWAALDHEAAERSVTISTLLGKHADAEDRATLASLSKAIGLRWPPTEPKARKKNYRERSPTDALRERAMEKDDFGRSRDEGSANDSDEGLPEALKK